MVNCAFPLCRNDSRKSNGKSFHPFPKDENLCKQWLLICKRRDRVNTKYARVCSDHFYSDDYEDDMRNRLLGLPQRRILKNTAVPSRNINEVVYNNKMGPLEDDEEDAKKVVGISIKEEMLTVEPEGVDGDCEKQCDTGTNVALQPTQESVMDIEGGPVEGDKGEAEATEIFIKEEILIAEPEIVDGIGEAQCDPDTPFSSEYLKQAHGCVSMPFDLQNQKDSASEMEQNCIEDELDCIDIKEETLSLKLEIQEDDDDEEEENEDGQVKKLVKPFQVDRSVIPAVAKSDQASELQDLEGLSVYNQDTLEAGILKQVDDALTGNDVDDVIDSEAKGDGDDLSYLNIGREETEMERSIRLGEMTPFGTMLHDPSSKRIKEKKANDIEGMEQYFRNQAELEKNCTKAESKQTASKSNAKKDPLQRKVLNRDGRMKKKRKKEKLGTKTVQHNDDVSGSVPGEQNYTYNEDATGSEYVPTSSEEVYSSDDDRRWAKGKIVMKNPMKGRKKKYKLPGGKLPEDWRSDDSDWDTSDEEYRRKRKRSRKELDDGDIDLYRHRISDLEELNGISLDDLTKMEQEKYHEFDGGYKVPLKLWDKLYNYQRVGVRWMWELDRQCCGGILGDEMGLGKTIQMIAFMAGLHCSQMKDKDTGYRGLGPSLIICPTTVMHQWVKEFHTWFPYLRIAVLHDSGTFCGKNKSELVQKLYRSGSGIIVLSYTGAAQQKEMLTTRKWHYVVLDEGHKIRNPDAQVTLVLKQLTTSHRIILSGSPMQNNLRELWSLFDFIFPGKLGTLPVFLAQFAGPITQGGYANASEVQVVTAYKCATVLRDTISPYLLRRMKSDVKAGLNLPEKNEQVLFCRLTDEQRQLYKGYVDSGEVERILRGHHQIFIGLIALRKICNHPDLYTGGPKLMTGEPDDKLPENERYGHWSRSGKMIVVETLLKLWKKQGHRVLLFTQGCQMLCILEAFVKSCGYKYLKLDGSTSISARQPLITKFNEDSSYFVMVLTTRVGGLGVNLTGANRVVIFDPDWNPATDTQARERAWRIGQKQTVTIYRLITAGAIEEKMYHRQIFKQFLTNKVLKDPRQRRFFKSNDLFELFTLKEVETEGSTETSAIFAGTASEVKLDPSKCYRHIKAPTKPKEEAVKPSVTFSKKKIEHMKRLAQQLSLKFSSKNSKETKSTNENMSNSNLDEQNLVKKEIDVNNDDGNVSNNNNIVSVDKDADINMSVDVKKETCEVDESNETTESCTLPAVTELGESAPKDIDVNKSTNSVESSEKSLVPTSVNSRRDIEKKKDFEQEKASTSRKHSDRGKSKKHKHKKHRKRKDAQFEGETVPHLVQHETATRNEEDDVNPNMASQDEYVLKKLFDKSGLQTAMQHDVIMGGGPSDYALVECEAEKVAKEAVDALKESRRECYRASAGVPTFTGHNGAIRQSSQARPRFGPKKAFRPGAGASAAGSSSSSGTVAGMTSSELINRIRERNLMKLPEDSDIRLLSDIREFILENGGTAATDQLILKFKARLPVGKSAVFKSLLAKISVFYRAPDKMGYWTLRDEFVW